MMRVLSHVTSRHGPALLLPANLFFTSFPLRGTVLLACMQCMGTHTLALVAYAAICTLCHLHADRAYVSLSRAWNEVRT
jgi:hypothetical protein